ncbi:transglycosylase SLT domain-containing protein [Brevundimonas sp. 2R-24]|uniref:Transglycosylase SLT domain-containing protein n=1 Tax=Peiella sedimenti TaxID=3061083 RepID=A0ABT8SII6_9CAUL|nr:transglycosylase SLT domain-containing protein [Caulobacteraceae bacterium XZ-24]
MSVGSIGQGGGVEAIIRRAAGATGVDFDFLMRTARRESALNPRAQARTSSAAGLFQFIEQTWLATVKRHGARHGYGQYANAISQGSDGRWRVDPGARRAVLDLRFDPTAASVMAGELASDHAAYLRGRIGREPTAGDLYAAHFLGPAGSARLIQAVDSRPGMSAAALFPEAAGANRPIFFRGGRPATVAEVYANLTRNQGAAPAAAPSEPAAPPMSERDAAIAERLDRLRQDSELIQALLGDQAGAGSSLFTAQLLGAFGPGRDDRA